MIVSHKHKFVFIAIPKNASRTIRNWLKKSYSILQVGGYHGVVSGYHKYLPFTTKRNPYSRFVSRWNMIYRQKNGYMPFTNKYFKNVLYPEFIKYMKDLPSKPDKQQGCIRWLYTTKYLIPQIYCIKEAQKLFKNEILIVPQNNLLEGLKNLPFVKDEKIELNNPGSHDYGKWQDYYQKAWVIQKIKKYYKDDFDALEYSTYIT